MKRIVIGAALTACMIVMTGCMTKSRLIPQGATAEVTAGFSQDDIDSVLETIKEEISKASMRYAPLNPGERRVINVKDITNDTLSRGRDADFLSEALGERTEVSSSCTTRNWRQKRWQRGGQSR